MCPRPSRPNLNPLQNIGFSAKHSGDAAILHATKDTAPQPTHEGPPRDGSGRRQTSCSAPGERGDNGGSRGAALVSAGRVHFPSSQPKPGQRLRSERPGASPSASKFLKLPEGREIPSRGSLAASVRGLQRQAPLRGDAGWSAPLGPLHTPVRFSAWVRLSTAGLETTEKAAAEPVLAECPC